MRSLGFSDLCKRTLKEGPSNCCNYLKGSAKAAIMPEVVMSGQMLWILFWKGILRTLFRGLCKTRRGCPLTPRNPPLGDFKPLR